jgi:hypothetical protein
MFTPGFMSANNQTYGWPIKAFVLALIVALVVHFSITLIYVFRDDMPIALNQKTDRYMAPVFHQNWKLFAPDLPRYNCELEFRLAINNEWTDWKDASAFYGHGKSSPLETIEQNILTQLNWQLLNNLYSKNGERQFDRIVRSTAYTDAMFMVMKMHRNANPDKREEMMQVRIRYQFTPSPGQQNAATEIIEFPIYAGESPS